MIEENIKYVTSSSSIISCKLLPFVIAALCSVPITDALVVSTPLMLSKLCAGTV
ncbi:hypothetical protein AWRI1631_74560 [Saccharomyces cerevisiae AWRI1631]|uniref:Uncharacterized protein n=1 Tax=Saccharomyces cerevisiae (strain AWRI1631) TaxID=545124 RepID=B5VJH5_YEAS6|nr:hypothetical protein AWRI1631_74560 [Saccharomyces cerevisiae AWRI1631]